MFKTWQWWRHFMVFKSTDHGNLSSICYILHITHFPFVTNHSIIYHHHKLVISCLARCQVWFVEVIHVCYATAYLKWSKIGFFEEIFENLTIWSHREKRLPYVHIKNKSDSPHTNVVLHQNLIDWKRKEHKTTFLNDKRSRDRYNVELRFRVYYISAGLLQVQWEFALGHALLNSVFIEA